MPTRTLSAGFVGTGDGSYSASVEVEADQWIEGSKAIAGETADQEEVVPFDKDNVQALLMVCDQDVTLETNSDSAPDDTLAFKANVPLIWHVDMPNDNPFSADVASFFLTNAGATAGTFKWCIGVNT